MIEDNYLRDYIFTAICMIMFAAIMLFFGFLIGRISVTEDSREMLENKRLELEIWWLESELEGGK